MDGESESTRYLSVELNLSQAFRFRIPSPEALGELREILGRLPVRPYRGGGVTRDTLSNTDCCDSLSEVADRLGELILADYQANAEEIGDHCEFEVAAVDSDLQPDALHVITRIWPKDGQGGELIYGLRVQRVEPEKFALWSDH